MRGFFVILLLALVAVFAGAAGFQAGVMANVGTATVPGYVWLWGFPHVGGFLFGFLFLFLLIGLFAFAVGGRRRGPWGRGYGRGWGYGPMDASDPRRQWIADAHRRLHEEEARRTTVADSIPSAPPSSASAGPAGPSGPADFSGPADRPAGD